MCAALVVILIALRALLTSANTSKCAGTAVYSINMETRWSAETHPNAFPGTDATFAAIHGATRSSQSHWVSPAQAVQCGGGRNSEQNGRFEVDVHCPQPGICEAMQELSVNSTSSFLSWHSFIVPTAGWFVGIQDFELCQSNRWITSARIPLFPYSEGTLEVPDCTIRAQVSGKQDITAGLSRNSSINAMWIDDAIAATRPLGHVTLTRLGNWNPHPSSTFPSKGIYPPDIPLPASTVVPSKQGSVQSEDSEVLDQSFPGPPGEGKLVLRDRDGIPTDVQTSCRGTARYNITVDVTWTNRTHPLAPAGASHWESLILFQHNPRVQLYAVGKTVNPGLAAYLANSDLIGLQQQQGICVSTGSCTQLQYGVCGTGSGGVCALQGSIETHAELPWLSMLMRASPSPDWFVGLHDYPLCQEGRWAESGAASLYLLDGGVVDGTTWELDTRNSTLPQQPVTIVGRGTSAWNPELGKAVSMGSVRIQLVSSTDRGSIKQEIWLQHLSEEELWQSELVGKQFPEIDMLSPFPHTGSELRGWQPPDGSSASRMGEIVSNSVHSVLGTCLGVLWLGLFSVVLS